VKIKDLTVQELEDTPETILEEILFFLRQRKQEHQRTKTVRMISDGEEVLVPLEDILETLNLKSSVLQQPTKPVTQIQQELREALAAGGYATREQIIELVQEVKHESALAKDWLSPEEDEAWKHL
jgi:hypothetical protein